MTETRTSVVRRTTLFVHDVKRATAFYEAVFGLTRYYEQDVSMDVVPAFPVQTQGQGGAGRLVILRGENPIAGMVGLLEMHDPPLPEPDHDVRRLGYGNAALVLSTTDAEAAAAQVEPLGGKILAPVKEFRNVGDEDGNLVPAKVFMAFDPDGHFLEAFEPL